MPTSGWRLSIQKDGRIGIFALTFLSKKMVQVPTGMVEEHLRIAAKTADSEYKNLVEKQEQAEFQTETGDAVTVSPRYIGSKLGSNDDGEGNTICALYFRGEYFPRASYNEHRKEIMAFDDDE